MAKDKNGFLMYADQISIFEALTDDEAGRLVKHLFRYVNDENPKSDRITELVFAPIRAQLKRDLEKWSDEREGRSKAGKLGMEKRWAEHNKLKQTLTKDNSVIKNVTNITDNVNVNDIVTDNVKKENNTIDSRKLKFASTLEPFSKKYTREMLLAFYKYWTEPNKSNTKFRQELQKTWDLSRRLETWASKDFNFNTNKNGTKITNVESISRGNDAIDELVNHYRNREQNTNNGPDTGGN